jgi:hypothetical protein
MAKKKYDFKSASETFQQSEDSRGKFSGWSNDGEDIQFCEFQNNKQCVFRFRGSPPDPQFREEPTDPKIVQFSRIVKDDGKSYSEIYWQQDEAGEVDKNWILSRFFKNVFAYDWVNYTQDEMNADPEKAKRTGYKRFLHANHPIFQKYENNRTNSRNLYPPKYSAGRLVVANVIDRQDNWCKENKHTKILVKKIDRWEDKRTGDEVQYVAEKGFPVTVLQLLYKEILPFHTEFDWNQIDLVIERFKEKPYYVVKDANDPKLYPYAKELASADPLTAEEESYELYDIDKNFGASSYGKLMACFGKTMQKWDEEFGTTFYAELSNLYNEEKEHLAKEKGETTDETAPAKQEETSEAEVKEPEQKKRSVKREATTNDSATSDDGVPTKEQLFPYYPKLSAEDKAILDENFDGVDMDAKKVKWKSQFGGCECSFPVLDTQSTSPMDISTCPVCGSEFS